MSKTLEHLNIRESERLANEADMRLRDIRETAASEIYRWGDVMARTIGKKCRVHWDDDKIVTRIEFY